MRGLLLLLLAVNTGPNPSPLPDATPTVRGAINVQLPDGGVQRIRGKVFTTKVTVNADAGVAFDSTCVPTVADLRACPSGNGLQCVRNYGWWACQPGGAWAQLGMVSATTPLNLEVDCALGSDGNDCLSTGAGACRSVAAALGRYVDGRRLRALVKIHVVGSLCAGFQVNEPIVAPTEDGGLVGLQIYGDMANVSPATGTSTGSLTSVTAAVPTTASFNVWTDATQAWTVNDLRGDYIKILNSFTTVTFTSAIAGDTIGLAGQTFTAVSGAPAANQFDISGTDTQDAASFAAAVNASPSVLISGLYSSTSSAAIATVLYVGPGILGGPPGVLAQQAFTTTTSNAGRLALSSGSFLGGGGITPIISNTATTLTVALNFVRAAGGVPYAIVDNTTVLAIPTQLPPTLAQISLPQSVTTTSVGIAVVGPQGVTSASGAQYLRIEQFKVALDGGTVPVELSISSPTLPVVFDHISLVSSVGTPIVGRGQGRFTFQNSVINHPVAANMLVTGTGSSSFDAPGVTVSNVLIRCLGNSASALVIGGGGQQNSFSNVQFDTDTLGAINGGSSFTQFSGIIKKTFSSNANFGLLINGGAGGAYVQLAAGSGMEISNSGASTALAVSRGNTFFAEGTLIGSSNLIGLSVAEGARVKISSGSTITGTTEISLDGTATTLAAMRAASPKLLTNGYGTVIYE